ncbi:MAG: HIT family protein [Candidatus Pacebacteria bacterium]|jgi:histidine triad (HIT) family protein|nr:HIT family protein [archaeon]MBT4397468.1 HIT family protein [archaeon]MBT4440540.1 HIT family protein [archaeon]MBT6920942.1 HIT family protein [Candidatus Paceibacterota bacterium]
MKECLFCKIIKGKHDCTKIWEDDHTFVFLSVSPAVPEGGHTLVIPKKHYELISDMPAVEYNSLMRTVRKFSKAVMKFSEGMNIVQNNKKIAGQTVPHVHFHLIPRFSDDKVEFNYWHQPKLSKKKMERVAEQIKELME